LQEGIVHEPGGLIGIIGGLSLFFGKVYTPSIRKTTPLTEEGV